MCLLHACSSIHGGGWLGSVHQALVREFASFESHRTGLKEQGCVKLSLSAIYRYSPNPECFREEGAGGLGGWGGNLRRQKRRFGQVQGLGFRIYGSEV